MRDSLLEASKCSVLRSGIFNTFWIFDELQITKTEPMGKKSFAQSHANDHFCNKNRK